MKSNRRELLLGLLAGAVGKQALAQTPPPAVAGGAMPVIADPGETIDLWPVDAPGLPANAPVETVTERSTDSLYNDRSVMGVRRPRMVVFRPQRANGAAMLIMPGGGYGRIVIDKEGYEMARWLNARGVTAFVLFYRLPGEGWERRADVALADTQRAMRLLRSRAGSLGIDPERIGAMGFSAGGHACANLATGFGRAAYESIDAADETTARPAIAAPIYAVISMFEPHVHAGSRDNLLGPGAGKDLLAAYSPHLNVPDDAPPHFLVHAEDDEAVPAANSLLLREALREKGIPVETHLFAAGGHGFGLRHALGRPAGLWPELFLNWAASTGFLTDQPG